MLGDRQASTTATSMTSTHGGLKLLRRPKNPAAVSGGMTAPKKRSSIYHHFCRNSALAAARLNRMFLFNYSF